MEKCIPADLVNSVLSQLGNLTTSNIHQMLLNISCPPGSSSLSSSSGSANGRPGPAGQGISGDGANRTPIGGGHGGGGGGGGGRDGAWSAASSSDKGGDLSLLNNGLDVYAYVTPFVIAVGVLGNILSLVVFLSRRMRKMSASFYLASLAVSDTFVLLTYVLIEWLHRGLPRWPGGQAINLMTAAWWTCPAYMFVSYAFRFASAWFIVAFTVERYVGICWPLKRRLFCRRTFARWSLAGVSTAAVACSAYKPLLVTVREVRGGASSLCTWRPDFRVTSFVLDAVYGALITVVPFVVILCLNLLICHRLRRTKRRYVRHRLVTVESTIKLEFTAILLVVSSAFIVLNVPYFVAWCYNFDVQIQAAFVRLGTAIAESERSRGWVHITKTIFIFNYCINFFIYSLSGAYFRCQLRRRMSCLSSWSDRASRYFFAQSANSQSSLRGVSSKV